MHDPAFPTSSIILFYHQPWQHHLLYQVFMMTWMIDSVLRTLPYKHCSYKQNNVGHSCSLWILADMLVSQFILHAFPELVYPTVCDIWLRPAVGEAEVITEVARRTEIPFKVYVPFLRYDLFFSKPRRVTIKLKSDGSPRRCSFELVYFHVLLTVTTLNLSKLFFEEINIC